MPKKYEEAIETTTTELLQEQPDVNRLKQILSIDFGIDNDDFNEYFKTIVLQVNNEIFPPVEKMELILTSNCNLSCRYCFESGSSRKTNPANMPEETIIEALDLFVDYSRESKELYLTFFGGEPTLSFHGIKLATEYIEQKLIKLNKKINFDMTSNGVLLKPEMIDYFSAHNINILLSIDGLKSSHDRYRIAKDDRGSYDAVISNLTMLKKKQPWVGVKMTVMPSEIIYLEDNVRGLYDMGVNQFLIGYATGAVWEDRQIHAYKQQIGTLRKWQETENRQDLRISEFENEKSDKYYYGCSAGRNTVSVATNGVISGCSRILTLGEMPNTGILGNTLYGLYNISNRIKMVSCDILKENCVSAGLADCYQGGCFAVNFEENRDLYAPSIVNHKFSQWFE